MRCGIGQMEHQQCAVDRLDFRSIREASHAADASISGEHATPRVQSQVEAVNSGAA